MGLRTLPIINTCLQVFTLINTCLNAKLDQVISVRLNPQRSILSMRSLLIV